tara:strand:+ start:1048 stop:2190 length:1143 start_codon:yes stop_codon:yes gene_type:complete
MTTKTLKKVTMRKTAKQITEDMAYGPEPTKSKKFSMADALNWYARAKSCEDAMKYLVEWAMENEYKDWQIKKLKKCPKYFIPNAYGWIARMDMNGIPMKHKELSRMQAWIKRGIDQSDYIADLKEQEEKTKEPSTKKSFATLIKEGIDEKASNIMSEIDGWVDDFIDDGFKGEYDLFTFLEQSNAKPKHVEIVTDRLGIYMAEFYLVQEGLDKDFCEAYAHLSKKQIIALLNFHENLKTQAEQYVKIHKSKKGPRKGTKYKNIGKLVEKLEVIDIDDAKSIDKVKIIGAKEVWAVTPKGDIKRFLSESVSGLSISGSTLKNVTSQEWYKAPLRSNSDKETFRKLLLKGVTKTGLKSVLKKFKTVDSTNCRIHKHLIWYAK